MDHIAFRGSGILLVVGAVLLAIAIFGVTSNPDVTEPLSARVGGLLLLAAICLLVALPAMYARQANAAGWLGLVGYASLQAGMLLLVLVSAPAVMFPSLKLALPENWAAFLLGSALTVGLLLTGIATTQAGVFPRWAGILLLAAMAGFFFNFFIAEFLPPLAGRVGSAFFGILLGLALAWVGLALVSAPMVALTTASSPHLS